MKLCWSLFLAAIALSMILTAARAQNDGLWEEDDKEVLVRTVRGTNERSEFPFLQLIRYFFAIAMLPRAKRGL